MFGSDDDDGGTFSLGMPTQPKGSNLSSLFGGPSVPSSNDSLMYTPQKQPNKNKEPTKESKPPPDTPQLLFASACHAFNIDGQYAPQGKLGAAVLGHLANKDYKILLYQSQKKPVTNARIHQNFKFDIQKNNYATFYDDQSQNWSVCFDSESQQAEFAKWVCLSRFNVSPSLTLQDLNAVDGQEVQKGDTVEMQYTGWLHAGNAFGKEFDTNKDTGKLLKFKVGKGKVIKGWEAGVIGMKKGMKRLLVIPADQAYGAKAVGDRVPANSILIFHVELTRVKFVNPQGDPDTVSLASVDGSLRKESIKTEEPAQPKDVADGTTEEDKDSIRDRSKSISDQLSKTPDTKSKLLERMSKMGQAMIPAPNVQKSSTTLDDDHVNSSDEGSKSQPIPVETHASVPSSPRPNLKPKPDFSHAHQPQQQTQPQTQPLLTQQQQHAMYANQLLYQQNPQQMQHAIDSSMYFQQQQPQQQLALYQSPQAIQNSILGINPALVQQSLQQQQPQQQQQQQSTTSLSSTEINLMMTDGKLKHSELKNDLTRLIEKVDAIAIKVTSLEGNNKQMQVALPQQAAEMEAAVLMQNITRIIKENAKLQTECEEKSKKIEKLNESMTDLLTKNQSFFEKSNQLLASQSDSMQNNAAQAMAKVSALEQRTIQLEADLSASRTQLLHAQKKEEMYGSQSAELTVQIETLQKQVRQYKEKIDSTSTSTNEHEDVVAELKLQIKAAKKEQKQLAMKLEQSEEEFSEAKIEIETFTKNIADMKKKRKEDKTKHDEEVEELRSQHEDELRNLKQRYGKSASSEAEKLNKLEEELTSKFDEKMKNKLKNLESDYKEKLQQAESENETLSSKLKIAQNQLKNVSDTLSAEYDEKLKAQLSEASDRHQADVEEVNKETMKLKQALEALENKIKEDSLEPNDQVSAQLDELRSKHNEEKNQLEERGLKLREELDMVKDKLSGKNAEIQKLQADLDAAYDRGVEEGRSTMKTISQASYERGLKEGKAAVSEPTAINEGAVKAKVTDEVKKVMNSVFFKLKGEFDVEENYTGKEVLGTILNVVREVTLKFVQKPGEEEDDDDDDDDDVDDDDDDEEEDESEEESEEEVEDEVQEKHEEAEPHPSEENRSIMEDPGQESQTNTLQLPSELSDDDDDNISFTSATSEPVHDEPKTLEETSPQQTVETERETSPTNAGKDNPSDERNSEEKLEPEISKNALKEIGLDSSMFGTKEDDEETGNEVIPTPAPVDNKEEESSLFFGATTTGAAADSAKKTEVEDNPAKNTPSKGTPSLFDDDDDDDFFAKAAAKPSSVKKANASAFNRSPPPLFDDEDDDTNWI